MRFEINHNGEDEDDPLFCLLALAAVEMLNHRLWHRFLTGLTVSECNMCSEISIKYGHERQSWNPMGSHLLLALCQTVIVIG